MDIWKFKQVSTNTDFFLDPIILSFSSSFLFNIVFFSFVLFTILTSLSKYVDRNEYIVVSCMTRDLQFFAWPQRRRVCIEIVTLNGIRGRKTEKEKDEDRDSLAKYHGYQIADIWLRRTREHCLTFLGSSQIFFFCPLPDC